MTVSSRKTIVASPTLEIHMRSLVLLCSGLLLATRALSGQNAPPPKCDAPEFRQFDFWTGEWRVTSGGQEAGTNLVTLEEGGCLIHEHWTGAGGGTGQSLNFYDRSDARWHQVWISSNGMALFLTGTYHDGRLEYTGERPMTPGGAILRHRLTFFRNPDGSVRQLWETSADGTTWQTAFDGHYARK
jgi:hypothetical protein